MLSATHAGNGKAYLESLLAPLGQIGLVLAAAFNPDSYRHYNWRDYIESCRLMGPASFPIVSLSAVFVGSALTLQTVLESQRFGVEHFSGAFIAIGLLRELGPLTVGISWAGRVAAIVAEDARRVGEVSDDAEFASSFILPRLAAAWTISVPLDTYGLIIGFTAATVTAAIFGGISPNDFLESARVAITNKDVWVFYGKLSGIVPPVTILTTAVYLSMEREHKERIVSRAITAAMIACYIATALFSYCVYAPSSHGQRYAAPDLRFGKSVQDNGGG
jgi:ABC-type transporter Mla maintaining outer membrane lipid asymmetry permease subunit MlaE